MAKANQLAVFEAWQQDPSVSYATLGRKFKISGGTAAKYVKEEVAAREMAHASLGEVALVDPYRLFLNAMPTPYNPSELVTRKGLRLFDAMRQDDQIKMAMGLKKLAVMSAGYTVESPEGKDQDWEPRAFIEEQLDELPGSFDSVLMEIMTSLEYGYSVTEKVLQPVDGLIGLKALKTKKPHSFEFDIDAFGNLKPDGLIQDSVEGPKRLPVHKFIIHTHQREFSNVYGRSDLESAYRAWWTKDNAYKWMAMLLERFGIPPVFALYNPNKYGGAMVDKLYTAVKTIQAATSGVIPRGTPEDLELWSPELAGQVHRVFMPAMDMFNRDIARGLLVPSLIGATPEDSQGSRARSQVHFDTFITLIQHLQKDLAEQAINDQLVRPLVDLNFGGGEYPVFKFLPISDDVRTDILERWQGLIGVNAVTSQAEDETHIRSLLRFPEKQEQTDEESRVRIRELFQYHLEFGLVTINEGRAMMGLPPVADGDRRPTPIEVQAMRGAAGKTPPEDEEDDEDEDDPFDDGLELETRQQIRREPNRYEKKVDFAQVERDFEGIEEKAREALSAAMTAVRDTFISHVQRNFTRDASFVRGVKELRKMPQVRSAVGAFMREAFDAGRTAVREELADVAEMQEDPNVKPTDALKRLKARELWVTGIIEDDLVSQSKRILLRAIETGEAGRETEQKLKEAFQPYIGDPKVVTDEGVVSANRLETIVRTNTTDAYNRGRMVQAREAGSLLQAFEYSAIMDSRTTEVCAHLDGKIIRADDPDADRLAPPRHFNCRSLLVPVTIGEPVEKFASKSEVGKGLELSGEGFK